MDVSNINKYTDLRVRINTVSRMDKQRRRELKAEGKRRVEEYSNQVHQRLAERNPFPVGDPNWVRNLQAEYKINREYRKNDSQVLLEAGVIQNSEIKILGFNFDKGFMPHAGWYVLCENCRNLVPTKCACTLLCSCGAVAVMPETRQYLLPPSDKYKIVELIGRGPIRSPDSARQWWKFWR
ncbi:hypothetical protein [Pseudogulbenkiania ferrooxidans]|uniref:hypothetical protein n=1 Tax=Pseudogulbenkiania ferrooxidans TaxID=549169 RepID=UPI0012377C18|nr:hypothetical protein [Pseudogulbenkiania ferrooxidans]